MGTVQDIWGRAALIVPLFLFAFFTLAACSDFRPDGLRAPAQPPAKGAEFKDCADCPAMIVVPAGQLMMGSPATEIGRSTDETRHLVTFAKPFAVGKYGVTFDEWAPCVAAGACPSVKDGTWGGGRRPVIYVSWDEADGYTRWLAKKTGKPYRLLSEAEMEYTARAGTRTLRYWGDKPQDACKYANVYDVTGLKALNQAGDSFPCDDGYAHTAPVGSFMPNAFGLYDAIGNVLNWTEDCYHDSFAGAPIDGSAWVSGDCARRVRRGGSFHSLQNDLRVAKRGKATPTSRGDFLGFRVALGLTPKER